MKALVTMGFNNGEVVENLRYRYNINAGWIPNKGLPFSVRAIVSIAINNLYFFRDDNIANSLQLLSRLLIAPSQCLQSLEQCA